MKNKLFWVVILIGVVVLGYKAYQSYTPDRSDTSYRSDQAAVAPTAEEQKTLADTKAAVSSDTKAVRYSHPTLGFSFEKPEGYTVGAIPGENGAQTLVVQPTSGAATQGFQIVISPLDAPMTITPALVQKELPGTAVGNPKNIVLDKVGKGMMFSSNNEAFGGKSYEIWFTTSTHLYQVTSYASFASQLQAIIGTWQF